MFHLQQKFEISILKYLVIYYKTNTKTLPILKLVCAISCLAAVRVNGLASTHFPLSSARHTNAFSHTHKPCSGPRSYSA